MTETSANRLASTAHRGRDNNPIRLLLKGRALFALIAIIIVFSVLSPNYFTVSNFLIMASHVAIYGILAIGIYTATYVAETLRAGINTVPVGQAEAARAIGLPFGQVMSLIVLPQAFRSVVPPMMSVFIALLKNTTVAAGFSIPELAALRATINESHTRPGTPMEVLLWVALIFVVLVLLMSWAQNRLEKRWKVMR